MKKIIVGLAIAFFAATANAGDFFGGDDGEWKMGPYGPYWDESDWPEWTPMYWMEEFMDEWDDNDDEFYGGGMPMMGGGMPGGGYGMPYGGGYGMPSMPYGGGYGMPAMPYGGGYGNMPYGGYPAPAMPAPVAPVAPVAPTQ